MNGNLSIDNHQRAVPVDARQLRRVTGSLLRDHFGEEQFDLGIHLVGREEMARLNEMFLRHRGSTDVITFDYSQKPGGQRFVVALEVRAMTEPRPPRLHGEIFICMDEAIFQARRFRTSWQSELARYVIHGLLHLRGFDDRRADDRRKMKRAEARLLAEIARRFPLRKLARRPRLAA